MTAAEIHRSCSREIWRQASNPEGTAAAVPGAVVQGKRAFVITKLLEAATVFVDQVRSFGGRTDLFVLGERFFCKTLPFRGAAKPE